jgi:intracellular sulfur oxidation DsrE/DsrF family protein
MTPADAHKEWAANLLPGAYLVPSGVLAVHRAQNPGKCTYCAAVV